MKVRHPALLSNLFLTASAQADEIEVMSSDLIACHSGQALCPMRKVTEIELNHLAAAFADDMVVVARQAAELIACHRSTHRLKHDSQGGKKLERSVNRGQADALLLSE